MTDPVLKTIIRLCSLFANIDDKTDQLRTRELLRAYLNNYTKGEFIDHFLYVYDFYLKQQKTKGEENFLKKASLRAVKAIRLINNINKELLLGDKYLLVIFLLEIIRFKKQILPEEFDFIETLAISFNLNEKEFYNLKNFILKSWAGIPWKDNFIIINSKKPDTDSEFKHIHRKNLVGNICLLQIKSINSIWFYYDGDQQLFLNNTEIEPLKIYAFNKGNTISKYKLGFHNVQFKPIYYTEVGIKLTNDPHFKNIEFNISNIEFEYPNTTNGIKPFSFNSESHLLVGIIGPSGSGKSTLMNLLNGTLNPDDGKVTINGINLHEKKKKLKGIIGHVPQDDLLFEELTVYENLYFNAKLCFSDYNEKQIEDTVKKILNELELLNIRDLKVGSSVNKVISGGQRKRLNIGMELMREPSILFVDEPTSGLSSNDSVNVINILREQTLRGKLVVMNIHQPSSKIFKAIDQLIVLDEGGYVVYAGDPLDALVYFKTLNDQINPAEKECTSCGSVNPESILEIIEEKKINEEGRYTSERKVSPKEWYTLYNENRREQYKQEQEQEQETQEIPSIHFKIPGKLKQFLIFSQRNLLSKLSNTQYILISLIEAPLLATILAFFSKYNAGTEQNPNAYIFSENINIPAYILMSIIVSLFIGMLISAEEIIRDQKILIREKFLNLSRFSYINSKVLFLFILSAIQTLSYVLLGNLILEIKALNFHYWLILFSTACFANILGLFISSNLKSVIAIYILIPFLIIPQILLSGTIVKFDKLHSTLTTKEYPPIIADLMPSRWAFEALAVSHFVDNAYEKNYYEIDRIDSEISYKLNFLIPEINSYVDEWRTIQMTSKDSSRMNEIALTVSNSMKKSLNRIPHLKKKVIDIDNMPKFEQPQKYQDLLDFARIFYSEYLNKILYQRDVITDQLINKYGTNGYINFKNANHNKAITNMLLKMNDPEKLFVKQNVVIRKYEPIFIIPENSFGRAQFYSPLKKLGNNYHDTLYFNTLIIWLISGAIYLALVFNILNKISFNRLKNIVVKERLLKKQTAFTNLKR